METTSLLLARDLVDKKSQWPLHYWTVSCVLASGAPRRATVAFGPSFPTILDKACQAFSSKPAGMIYSPEELEKEGGPQSALYDLSDLLDEYSAHLNCEWDPDREYNAQTGMQELVDHFKEVDKDGSGKISMRDLVGLIMDVQPALSEENIKTMCADALSKSESDMVDYSAFIQWMFK